MSTSGPERLLTGLSRDNLEGDNARLSLCPASALDSTLGPEEPDGQDPTQCAGPVGFSQDRAGHSPSGVHGDGLASRVMASGRLWWGHRLLRVLQRVEDGAIPAVWLSRPCGFPGD